MNLFVKENVATLVLSYLVYELIMRGCESQCSPRRTVCHILGTSESSAKEKVSSGQVASKAV